MSDSSSQSDDTSYGSACRGRRKQQMVTCSSPSPSAISRRRKGALNAKERNLRRLESNERERMRMHSLNDAFQVSIQELILIICYNRFFIFVFHTKQRQKSLLWHY